MKNIFLISFIFLILFRSFSLSTTFGFINDNYTGTVENGEKGRYLGADDFLTFSLLNITKHNELSFFTTWKIVTSRKYQFRYDYLAFRTNYDYTLSEKIKLTPKIGFVIKGNLGGENFQNEFHKFRNLPTVHLDYLQEEKFAMQFGFDLEYRLLEYLNIYMLNNIPTDILPVSTTLLTIFSFDFKFFSLNTAMGYKFYYNEVKNYTDFANNGIVSGLKINIPIIRGFSIDSSLYFLTAENLKSYKTFKEWKYNFTPQIWVGLAYHANDIDFKEILSQY